MRQPRSLATAAFAAALLYLTSSLFGRDCPPETFNYGPSLPDEEVVEIVLDHYGPNGPLVPTLGDYTHASRDVSLIRKFIPLLASATHQPAVPPGYFWVLVNDPNDAELACLNTYYAATMHYYFDIPPFSLWTVVFPQSVNSPPLMAIYADLPAVESAFPDAFGCPTDGCCSSRWGYAPLNGGTWRWQVHSGTPFGPGYAGCWILDWVFTVSDEGVVSQSPDLNGDGVVNVDDLLAVINAWGACPGPTGGHCPPDLDSNGVVNVDDLLRVINHWG